MKTMAPLMRLMQTVAAVFFLACSNDAQAHGDEIHDHADAAPVIAASTPAGAAPKRLADGSVYVPKPVQRQWQLLTRLAKTETLHTTIALNGTVIADPDTAGRIQAAQAGTVLPGPKGMPVPGLRVQKGEVLVYLRFAADAFARGNQQAQLAELDAQLLLAEKRLQRLEQLVGTAGALSQESLDTARADFQAMKKRRAFVSASLNSNDALIAPVSGVISASHVMAGQVVEPRELLFEIIDPSRLWVEALAYDAALAGTIRSATACVDPALALDLQFVGGGRQLREQALPLLFRINSKNPAVAVGQPVQVLVGTSQTVRGVNMPRAALTRSGAQTGAQGSVMKSDAVKTGDAPVTVWVHTGAERFEPRQVQVQALHGNDVAILAGLHDGDRVVVQGANLLPQVR